MPKYNNIYINSLKTNKIFFSLYSQHPFVLLKTSPKLLQFRQSHKLSLNCLDTVLQSNFVDINFVCKPAVSCK